MQITLSGHHVDITDALRAYANDKLSKLEHHCDDILSIKVILQVEKNIQLAEASVHIKGAELFAKADSDDMYAAIDALIDKLDRQLLSHKNKTIDRKQNVRKNISS
jgi:putative sigma-54 modulation protein